MMLDKKSGEPGGNTFNTDQPKGRSSYIDEGDNKGKKLKGWDNWTCQVIDGQKKVGSLGSGGWREFLQRGEKY